MVTRDRFNWDSRACGYRDKPSEQRERERNNIQAPRRESSVTDSGHERPPALSAVASFEQVAALHPWRPCTVSHVWLCM